MKMVMDKVMRIDHRRTFPKYAFGTFEGWMRKQREAQAAFPEQVSYFHGCYVNYNNPPLGKDFVRVMNALGIGVQLLKKEKCCGVALISNGLINQAKRQAEVNIASIRESVVERGLPVLGTSSTCTFTLRDEYPHQLGIDTSDVRDSVELATPLYLPAVGIGQGEAALPQGCAQGEGGLPYPLPHGEARVVVLLDRTVEDDPFGGADGARTRSAAASREPTASRRRTTRLAGHRPRGCSGRSRRRAADVVATDCETCKWQIEMSTSKRVEHPLSILAAALDVE